MNRPKLGLLPLYLELYDNIAKGSRPRIDSFYDDMATALDARGLDIIKVPICRIASEFEQAVKRFEAEGADGIITLHLAYSPSLESDAVLARTTLPIIVLNTTPTHDFSALQDPAEIMYNHGIHGVQDMCNLLLRNGKPFKIEAGHWEHSDVLDRVCRWARAACVATAMRQARVGRIGNPFAGMGDFAVESDELNKTIGVEVVPVTPSEVAAWMTDVRDAEVADEIEADQKHFVCGKFARDVHVRSVRTGLAIRHWMKREQLSAFTVNFMEVDRKTGMDVMPFLEASKAMGRGVGYAGEGDVLTAALVGALMTVFPDTSFTEMFCADWKNDAVFLSHMGEMNFRLTDGKAHLDEKPSFMPIAENPVLAWGRFRPGSAVFVNLAPLGQGRYRLIVSPVVMCSVEGKDRFEKIIHGWFTPSMPIADFLADYSRLGGTHHAALVYGEVVEEIAAFGDFMGWDSVVL